MRANILLFVLGAWLLQRQPELPQLQTAWLLAPLLVAGLWLRSLEPSGARAQLLLPGAVFLKLFWLALGFFWAAFFAHMRLADALPSEWESKDIQIIGVVADLPQEKDSGVRFGLDVEEVLTPQAAVPKHVSLIWFYEEVEEIQPQLRAGERWRLTVRLKRLHGNANPHGFDFEAWALERNIRATGYVRKSEENQRLSGLVNSPEYRVQHIRQEIRERFEQVLQEKPYAGVLIALAIGDQRAIPQPQWQVFTRTGVNHLMSISGLHVTMVSGLVAALVFWLWRMSYELTLRLPARKAAALAGAAAAFCYALISGFAVPTQRTVYMLSVVAAALWLGRISSSSLVLCLALALVTVLDPWAVLSPGFWLSFGAIALIMLVSVGRIAQPHWLRAWWNVQWAVTLGLIPVLLALFQQVSIISPLANAVAIPVVSLVVVPLILTGAVLPLDAILLLAHEIMSWCMALLVFMNQVPDAVWQQHAPPAWTIAVALIGAIWLLLPRGFPARWVGVIAVAPMFLVFPPTPAPGTLWLTVLDVGQGLAVVAQTQNHALLYDTGPGFSSDADSGNRIIVPYLRGQGIKRLDGMIVTHDDTDHSGGAVSVLDAVPVGWFVSSLREANPILAHAQQKMPCYAGQWWEWDGVRFDMLHPALQSYANPKLKNNARSCVLKITTAYGSALLPADIEKKSEWELLARAGDLLPSLVLVAPHHGSKTSSSEEFVRKVAPQVVIFPVGYRNRFGHPKEEVLERYRALGSRLNRTDESGAVTLKFENPLSIDSYRKQRVRYWHSK